MNNCTKDRNARLETRLPFPEHMFPLLQQFNNNLTAETGVSFSTFHQENYLITSTN